MGITITLTQILAVCAGISCMAGAVTWIIRLIKQVKAPSKAISGRVEAVEKELNRHGSLLDNDNKRLNEIQHGEHVTQRAIIALLSHGINGDAIESMIKARDELQEYLIER